MSLKTTLFCLATIFFAQALAASDKVVCYYASWGAQRPSNGQYLPEDIEAEICTHVNYAFLGLNSDGTLQILNEELDVNQEGFKRISALKQRNPNLKVMFSVGGAAADTGVFNSVSGSQETMDRMAQSAIEMCDTYGFDGLDVDWEYPRGGDRDRFINLLTTLKNAFQSKGYLVTVAVNSIPDEVGGYDIPRMSEVLDIINVMTYDFHAIWGGVTAQNSPLYGGDNESDWQKENRNADAAIKYWLAGGADPQKLTIGVAFYGHSFILADPSNNGMDAPTSGPGEPGPYTVNLGSLGYNEICEFHPNGNVVFLEDMRVPYLYDGNFWIGFDNEQSVTEKVQYAKEKNLAGVMIWSIETDDLHALCGQKNGLIKAIDTAMKK